MLKTRGPRRRERRSPQFLRHERLTVAILLAETHHHAAPRGQNMARSRGKARAVLQGHPQGSRPPCLGETRGPQDKVQQRTMARDDVPMLTLLDSLVPQMVDQLVAVLARYDTPIREQVSEVPKISCPPRFSRTVLRTPQMAEQLVEVPTVLSHAVLQQRNAE